MGGDLAARPEKAKAPTFLVWAEKDPDAANLDRIQIIKGWAKHGQSFEKIYNVAWSGGRSPDPKTGRLPPVGNTVDVAKATYTNTIGTDKLSAVWQDPEFDPDPAGLLLRARPGDPHAPLEHLRRQETGDHRPRPGHAPGAGVDVADLVHPDGCRVGQGPERRPLTVAGLEKDKAKALSTEEIKKLLVGKKVRIKNLVTGAEYDAAYGAGRHANLDRNRGLCLLARPRGGEESVCDQGRQTLEPVWMTARSSPRAFSSTRAATWRRGTTKRATSTTKFPPVEPTKQRRRDAQTIEEPRVENTNKGLRQSALVMKIVGWGLIVGLVVAPFIYAPDSSEGAFLVGSRISVQPILSRLTKAFIPMCSMIAALYLAWAPGFDSLPLPPRVKKKLAKTFLMVGMGADTGKASVGFANGRLEVDYDPDQQPIFDEYPAPHSACWRHRVA